MFSPEKGYKIRAKIHGKGGILLTSRLAYAPLWDWTAVAGLSGPYISYVMSVRIFLVRGVQMDRWVSRNPNIV